MHEGCFVIRDTALRDLAMERGCAYLHLCSFGVHLFIPSRPEIVHVFVGIEQENDLEIWNWFNRTRTSHKGNF